MQLNKGNGGQQTIGRAAGSESCRAAVGTSRLQSFKFLGSYKTATGDCTKDIKIRAALARQKATELINIWKDRNINTVLKVKVMKQMVWAVFLYGEEG